MSDHTNRLIEEKSPYLRQHAHNPVDWYPWGAEAFAKATREDKPILLSVGYSACHWCHVMERESFEDDEIAALMNERFVNIKVDREERPDVDQVYQQMVQMLTGHGGWPLTAFLTPDRRPYFGGTYFPPDERYGRPSFRKVLIALSNAWREQRADVEKNVEQLMAGLAHINSLCGPGELSASLAEEAATALLGRIDWERGGFRGRMKFPNASNLSFLLGRSVRGGDEQARRAVLSTLEKMAGGGIYDQLGGGFHRYSVDDRWLVPHFEKMLYDNAQLMGLYLDAWRLCGDASFLRIAEETGDYVLREMQDEGGGFYSTQDADSEGEEGKFFLWTPAELREVLGPEDAEVVGRYYGVSDAGNFENTGRTVLHLAGDDALSTRAGAAGDPALREMIERARAALFAEREKRIKPARDDKVITAWNGLMIGALARSPRTRHIDAAVRAATFLLENLRPEGRLRRSYCDGVVRHEGVLDDHAFLAQGLIELYQATFESRWLAEAISLADEIIERYWSPDDRAFYLTADEADLVQRPRSAFDQAVPSGAGVSIALFARLAALSGSGRYRGIVESALANYVGPMKENPFAFGTFLDAVDGCLRGLQEVVVAGRAEDPATKALVAVAREGFDPDRFVCSFDPASPPAGVEALRELLAGKGDAQPGPVAYLCKAQACSLPLTDPAALRAELD